MTPLPAIARWSSLVAVGIVCSSLPSQVGQDANYFGEFTGTETDGDIVSVASVGGVWYAMGGRRIRAESVVLLLDRDEYHRWFEGRGSGLPRRGTIIPDARRTRNPQWITEQFARTLSSIGAPAPEKGEHADLLKLCRGIYMEGDIVVIDSGIEVLNAKTLTFSVLDNRLTMTDAELRLVSRSASGPDRMLVVRAPKFVKRGGRITGRDVSLTTCTAGKPHFEVLSGEIEIFERENEFEVFSRANSIAFSGRKTVPLPDAHFFSSNQDQIPIKGVRGGYSKLYGYEFGVDLGQSMNGVGGAIHEFLTGRPAHEFRGEWGLGVGYIERRGNPLDAELQYRGGDLYQGRTNAFYLSGDRGLNSRVPNTNIDGTVVTESERSFLRSENRIYLPNSWTLDLTAFSASDPSVFSEFDSGGFLNTETPESSAHLRNAEDNRLFTLTGRTNLTSFSYSDDRGLSPSFRQEEPVATYDLFSEKLFEIWEADVLLTSATNTGWLKNEFDPRFAMPRAERTFRFDQDLELAAPFLVGPVAVRPFASGRYTHYDNTVDGTSDERWAWNAGISLTTRISRTFESTDADGNSQRIRHSIYPSVSISHAFQVDGRTADYFQFDEVDGINENGVIRVGVLNRLQKSTAAPAASLENPVLTGFNPRRPRADDLWTRQRLRQSKEFLYLDLAQNFFPISDRDNGGEVLGLGEYEVLWRPHEEWIPLPNFSILVDGEYDWRFSRQRTFNATAQTGKLLGLNWYGGYREDFMVDGSILYGVNTELFGRWNTIAGGAYDLQTSDHLYYTVMLQRRDHDWIITMSFVRNFITSDTTFRIDFEPLFGGLFRRRTDEFGGTVGTGPTALLGY